MQWKHFFGSFCTWAQFTSSKDEGVFTTYRSFHRNWTYHIFQLNSIRFNCYVDFIPFIGYQNVSNTQYLLQTKIAFATVTNTNAIPLLKKTPGNAFSVTELNTKNTIFLFLSLLIGWNLPEIHLGFWCLQVIILRKINDSVFASSFSQMKHIHDLFFLLSLTIRVSMHHLTGLHAWILTMEITLVLLLIQIIYALLLIGISYINAKKRWKKNVSFRKRVAVKIEFENEFLKEFVSGILFFVNFIVHRN